MYYHCWKCNDTIDMESYDNPSCCGEKMLEVDNHGELRMLKNFTPWSRDRQAVKGWAYPYFEVKEGIFVIVDNHKLALGPLPQYYFEII